MTDEDSSNSSFQEEPADMHDPDNYGCFRSLKKNIINAFRRTSQIRRRVNASYIIGNQEMVNLIRYD